jgi:hypothetical protein
MVLSSSWIYIVALKLIAMEQHLNDEQLREENDFLKMKLMLEKGAEFHESAESKELPPEVENVFLKNIMELERQFEESKVVKIFDKIKRPSHFKPPAEISDEEAETAWAELLSHMNEHGIHLDACSPKVSKKELYRFALEELFEEEINDMNIPGIMHGFIYDEYHPDYEYENKRLSVEHAIRMILRKEPMEWMFGFYNADLRLNDHHPLSEIEFKSKINTFKTCYDSFEEPTISDVECVLEPERCSVQGCYSVTVLIGHEKIILAGNWQTFLEKHGELGYWYIHGVEIQGINF